MGNRICSPESTGRAEPVAAIILAAGASRRLGQPKQLVQLHGEPLVHRAARLALEAGCSPVVVVLGACDGPCRTALADLASVLVVHHPGWAQGMGSTLRCAMEALLANPDTAALPDAVLVMVVDQLQLSTASLTQLLQAHAANPAPATAAAYSNRLGVPAIFRRELFPKLLSLFGDQGARALLTQLGSSVTPVSLPEAVTDLDIPVDLAQLS